MLTNKKQEAMMPFFDNVDEFYEQTFTDIRLDTGVTLSKNFYDCTFENCAFESVVLDGCTFSGCTFKACNLSLTQVPNSAFPNGRFENCKLVGIDWTSANWSKSRLGALDGFYNCTLAYCTFIGLSLPKLQIINCTVSEVDFREADLSGANFKESDLTKSLFAKTNLSGADLSRAKNYQIDPTNNQITQAKFALPAAIALLKSMDIVIDTVDWM